MANNTTGGAGIYPACGPKPVEPSSWESLLHREAPSAVIWPETVPVASPVEPPVIWTAIFGAAHRVRDAICSPASRRTWAFVVSVAGLASALREFGVI
jgi:hypothetical protein